MALLTLVCLSAQQEPSSTSSAPSCGTFCFTDTSGRLLLGPPDMPAPSAMTRVLCKAGRQLPVEFVGLQKGTAADNGRQSAHNFHAQAGALFRVLEGKTDPDES